MDVPPAPPGGRKRKWAGVIGMTILLCAPMAACTLTLAGLAEILPAARCRDGWRSPSIGRQGACSWHGGVARGRGQLAGMLSLGAGALTFFALKPWADRTFLYVPRPPVVTVEPPPIVPPRGGPACPSCGAGMVLRVQRRGRRPGNVFYGCRRYPHCRGTRNASKS